jgi:DeoR family transcriptional regulator, copper-sensing transcriptional repressor
MTKTKWSKLWPLVVVAWLLLMPMIAVAAEQCPVCGVEPMAARVVVTLENGKQEAYGCMFCALSALDPAKVAKAQVTDFMSRTLVPAAKAFYVKDSSYGECCVNWLSFASKQHALNFAKGFGGEVLTFDELVKAAKK